MARVDLSKVPQRAIIIAAGEATRWNNYLGVAKHFIEIDGEKLIHRTVRLLKENGVDDIHIVANTNDYSINGANLYKPKHTKRNDGVDKFLNSQDLWLDNGRTIVLYGDVYFTDEAMKTICEYNHRDWTLFARPYGSNVTGTPWGECFAQTFYEDHIPEHLRNLEKAVNLYQQKKIMKPSGWQHYRFMIGVPDHLVDRHWYGDRMIRIDDETDDFDTKEDYISWFKNCRGIDVEA